MTNTEGQLKVNEEWIKKPAKMSRELKTIVHEMIENATRALKRNHENDDHWKVLLSLLRFSAQEFIRIFEEGEEE